MGRGTDARPRCHAARHSDVARRRGVTRRQAGGTSEPLPPPRPSPREARRRRAARRLGNSRGRSSSVCPTQPHVGSGIRDDPTRPASPTVLLVSRPALGARVQPPPIVILPTTSSASVIRPWAASPAVAASNRIQASRPRRPPDPGRQSGDRRNRHVPDVAARHGCGRKSLLRIGCRPWGLRFELTPTDDGSETDEDWQVADHHDARHSASLGQGSQARSRTETVPGPDEWRL